MNVKHFLESYAGDSNVKVYDLSSAHPGAVYTGNLYDAREMYGYFMISEWDVKDGLIFIGIRMNSN